MADEHIAGGDNRLLQKRAVRGDGWTASVRETFLRTLVDTCNVTAALAAAGKSAHSAYALRKRDPGFAGLWREALALGYERLEEALLRHALTSVGALDLGDIAEGRGEPAKPMTASEAQVALAILARYRAVKQRGPDAPHGGKRRTPEQTDALLRRKLDTMARYLATRDAAREASEKAVGSEGNGAADPAEGGA